MESSRSEVVKLVFGRGGVDWYGCASVSRGGFEKFGAVAEGVRRRL